MKKVFSTLILLLFATNIAFTATEQFSLSSYLNKHVTKITEKENEINAKIEAQKKEAELKKQEQEKKRAEQQKALEAKKAELKAQQEANMKAIEQAKKDAESRRDATNKAIENEANYWKGVFSQK
ncbi:hypothetical protein IKB17_00735 [bacterium]|nr:hypothetical protein [bacterium]